MQANIQSHPDFLVKMHIGDKSLRIQIWTDTLYVDITGPWFFWAKTTLKLNH